MYLSKEKKALTNKC